MLMADDTLTLHLSSTPLVISLRIKVVICISELFLECLAFRETSYSFVIKTSSLSAFMNKIFRFTYFD
jgi:hypothetical protein